MNIQLQTLDWCIIGLFFLTTVLIGVMVSKRSGRSEEEFFLGGRGMPWWLLGFSMVATTFSTDTPNLVTDIVRTNGVFGNWVWWCMLPSGMLTAFLYARLWRRLGVVTDLEFYELRYSGRTAVTIASSFLCLLWRCFARIYRKLRLKQRISKLDFRQCVLNKKPRFSLFLSHSSPDD